MNIVIVTNKIINIMDVIILIKIVYLMKVAPDVAYCMNLDSRTDRLAQIKLDFKKFQNKTGISLERISSILDEKNPQRGTAQTVAKIIKRASELKLEYVLIVEDDLEILDVNKVQESLMDAPNEWDILSGGVYHYCPDGEYNEHWMKLSDFCSLHFVIIHNRCYNVILELCERAAHLDRIIGTYIKHKKLEAFVMNPMPCRQRAGYSNIRKRFVDDNTRKNLPWVSE